jgi:hypothetical protein
LCTRPAHSPTCAGGRVWWLRWWEMAGGCAGRGARWARDGNGGVVRGLAGEEGRGGGGGHGGRRPGTGDGGGGGRHTGHTRAQPYLHFVVHTGHLPPIKQRRKEGPSAHASHSNTAPRSSSSVGTTQPRALIHPYKDDSCPRQPAPTHSLSHTHVCIRHSSQMDREEIRHSPCCVHAPPPSGATRTT